MKVGIDRCGSPMERLFADACSSLSRWQWRSDDDDEHEVGTWPGWSMVLLCQVRVDRYRPDFLITTTRGLDSEGSWVVMVEIDGHDFHERTKEQAQRDRSRDRFFTERDVRVLRFTGSEVYANALACAKQAWLVAARMQDKLFNEEFSEWLQSRASEAGVTQ